ncbi:MAG: Endoribonuclease EndoA [Syntrophomonadaceae bacterium]|nr:Endoribonuclease EndoA [Bacillota bacterium]
MQEDDSNIKYGEVYYVLPARAIGAEQQSGRPAVVVSNNTNNRFAPTIEIVYLTRQVKGAQPTHVEVDPSGGIQRSTLLCEQINTVSKLRLTERLGILPHDTIRALKKACAVSINITASDLADNCSDVVPREQYTELARRCKELHQLEAMFETLKAQNEQLADANIRIAAERDVFKQLYIDTLAGLNKSTENKLGKALG